MSETNNSNEVVVSIKNLQKAFGDNVVLRDIDLDVHKGEVVVVLGPSGSGKSTMLQDFLLLPMHRPLSNSQRMNHPRKKKKKRRRGFSL